MDHLLAYMDCIPEIQHWGILENAFYSCHFFPSFCYYIELRLPDLAHTVYNNWTKFSFLIFLGSHPHHLITLVVFLVKNDCPTKKNAILLNIKLNIFINLFSFN